jgi:hypothetical protein
VNAALAGLLGLLTGLLLGIAFCAGVYLGAQHEGSPAVAQPVYVERLISLRVEGLRDSNTTGRYQRFQCKEAPP